jgi:hypothetical protein
MIDEKERYRPAAFSPEGRISTALRQLGCSENEFANLVGNILSKSRLYQALSDSRKALSNPLAERLLEKVSEMQSLQGDLSAAALNMPVALNWGQTTTITNVLLARLVHRIQHELGDDSLQSTADRATAAAVGRKDVQP